MVKLEETTLDDGAFAVYGGGGVSLFPMLANGFACD